MTDEEKAEEYCNNEVPFDTTESGEKLYTENDLKYAYLAGLKAGKDMNVATKWHKVADGDLPPTSSEMHAERYPILACTKSKEIGVTVAIRRKHGWAYEWFCSDYDGTTLFLDKEVIAWCEIPEYTEE